MAPLALLRRPLRTAKAAPRRAIKRRGLGRRIAASRPLRVVLGAGGACVPSWIATDVDLLDTAKQNDWHRLLAPASIDTQFAKHLWKHFKPQAGRCAARNSFRFPKAGGNIGTALPDSLNPDPGHRNLERPAGCGPDAGNHRVLYDYHTFSAIFEACGNRVELLESLDENVALVFHLRGPSDGVTSLLSRFDERNADGTSPYMSTILDAMKKAP